MNDLRNSMNVLKKDVQETGNGPGWVPGRESDLNIEAEGEREGGREGVPFQVHVRRLEPGSVTLLSLLASLQEV